MNCKDLVALVTGGASGLGKATVTRLVKEGSRVVLCDLPGSSGADVAAEIGDSVKFVPVDVYNEQDINKALTTTKETFGKLNVVVNCAGISIAYKTYNFNAKRAHSVDDFERVLKVNTIGTFNVCKLAAPYLYENELDKNCQRGLMINTSSFAAFDGQEGQVAYATSKAAIAGMTLPLARDFGSIGIRVCCIAPGLFDTPLTSILPEKVRIFFAKMTVCPQRLGVPDEYAQLVQHIIENPFMNANIIRLDGGLRMI